MKVLAVRGKNLASLPQFEIDFDAEPLANAGVFSIVGPTGSGKSTLLDAICLALFNKTPRTADAEQTPVGGDLDARRIANSRDPRAVLRHGAAEGFAEVDFSTPTGRYRSCWAVRRARRQSTGNLQPVTMRIFEHDGTEWREVATQHTTDALKQLARWIGLEFEQFCRAVLLAQGEFAAFLKAPRNEKTKILERLTQTEVYRQISMAAHHRHKMAAEEHKQLCAQLEKLAVLSPEDRTALEAELSASAAELDALNAEHQTLLDHRRWFAHQHTLAQRVAQAESALVAAAENMGKTEALAAECAVAETVDGIRHLVEAVDRCAAELADATAVKAAATETLARAAERETAATKILETTEAGLRDATKQRDATEPEIRAARQLDAQITAAQSTRAKAENALGTAKADATAQQSVYDELNAQQHELNQTLAVAQKWLAKNGGVRDLAAQWDRLRQRIDELACAQSAQTKLQAQLDTATTAVRTTRAAATKTAKAAGTAAEKLAQATAEVDSLASNYDAESAAALDDLRVRLARDAEFVAALAKIAQTAIVETAEIARQTNDRDAARSTATDARERAKTAAQMRNAAEAELADWRQQHDDLRTALDLSDHRSELRTGEPCPLCGSLDHPWHTTAPKLDQPIKRAAAQVAKLEKACKQHRETEIRADADAAQADRDAKKAAEAMAICAERLTAIRENWTAAMGTVADQASADLADAIRANAFDLDATTTATWLDTAHSRTREKMVATERQLTAIGETRRKLESVQKAEKTARAAHDKAAQKAREAEEQVRENEQIERELREKIAGHSRDAQRLIAELAPVCTGYRADWESAVAADSAGFVRRASKLVREWNATTDTQAAAQRDLTAIAPKIAAARATLKHKEETATTAATVAAEAISAHDTLVEQRHHLLSGAPADAVEEKLRATVESAEQALSKARQQLRDAERHTETQRSALSTATHVHTQSVASHAQAIATFEREIAATELSLSEADVRRILGMCDRAWIARTRQQIQQWREQFQSAQTIRDERQRQLSDHEKTPPPMFAEAVEARIHAVLGEIERVSSGRTAVEFRRQTDDANREKAAELAKQLDIVTARTNLRAELNELIGSAEGNVFAQYAQSLALDDLLAYANENLESLYPRFRLQRVPGQELALQMIDTEMADDVRAVSTLSGGETFLVSLALALALSNICSQQMRIESLFIDEGFGSLDPDTLEMALSVLDRLQAAGRQIGVISHVPGLQERLSATVEVAPVAIGESHVRVLAAHQVR